MSLKSVCPMIATQDLPRTRAFYDWLGFKVVCADPRGLQFAWPGEPGLRIGFTMPEDTGVPAARFDGTGITLRFDVEDVETLYRRIGAVHTLAVKLREGPCGRQYFAIVDPNGLMLEFAGPLSPAPARRIRPDGAARTLANGARAVLYPQTVQAMVG